MSDSDGQLSDHDGRANPSSAKAHARDEAIAGNDVVGLELRLVDAALTASGDRFFKSLVHDLAGALDADSVVISEIVDASPNTLRTLAAWVRGKLVDDFKYMIDETPCTLDLMTGRAATGFSACSCVTAPCFAGLKSSACACVGVPLKDSTGDAIGCIFVRSITPLPVELQSNVLLRIIALRASAELERRRSSRARLASEVRYRTLFESASEAIFLMRLTDDGPVFLDCNQYALDMFGRTRDEVVGKSPGDASLSPPTQADGRTSPIMAETVAQAANDGTPQFFEWMHYRADGTIFHTEVSLNRLDLDGITHILAITRDISQRKVIEQARADSEARYRTLFETAGDAIFLMEMTEEGPIFLDCNSRALVMFDRPLSEIVGRSPADPALSLPTQSDGRPTAEYAAELVRAALAGTPQRFEWAHYRRDGSIFYAEVTLNRLDLGETVFIQAITRDITERKEAEAFERLLMSELDHRVRNNLTSILALIETTSATCGSQQELREKLTGRIHAISITQEGLAARNWLGIQINEIIHMTLQQYGQVELRRFVIEGPEVDMPAGVSGPFSMCINELATNAIRHGALSKTDGDVKLTWTVSEDQTIEVHWRESGGPPIESVPEIEPGRGLGLIKGFIEHQLRGTFSLECDDQTFEVTLRFPLIEQTYQMLQTYGKE